jgi:hypothetical protein
VVRRRARNRFGLVAPFRIDLTLTSVDRIMKVQETWIRGAVFFAAVAMLVACDGGGHAANADAADARPADATPVTDAPPTDGALNDDAFTPFSLHVTADHCPTVIAAATPSGAPLGQAISLSATAVDLDGDPLMFRWTAPSGTFSTPTLPSTHYTCAKVGQPVLAITVSDQDCDGQATIPIDCQAGP